jgi:serine/threonine protein kinase
MTANPIDALEQIIAVADRFESAWRKGQRPRIEEFLNAASPAHRCELLRDLLEIELEIRRQGGEFPGREEYLDRFPDNSAVLEDVFASRAADSTTMPTVEGYTVLRLLGSGGFSEVWLAEDLNLFQRPVALKMIKHRTSSAKRRAALEVLRNEAELLTRVSHPNLVQVHGWRESDENPVLVLQYVPGGSLADRLEREGPLSWQVAARYVADVGEGLMAVHGRGIIHRDIKPANILWDPEIDEALLTDLGVGARLAGAGGLAGTIPYMAPEAFDGIVSASLDVYGLAATLYTLVTGHKPFPGPTIADLRLQAKQGLPDPDPRCAGLPEPLERIVRTGLAVEPEHRPNLGHFVGILRATLNQLLADTLTMSEPAQQTEPATEPIPGAAPEGPVEPTTEPEPPLIAAVGLHLMVSRQTGLNKFVPIAATRASEEPVTTRDMSKVPPPPEQIRLRTGHRVRIEVVADRPGYITVFNIGPTGNLSLLYPDESLQGVVFRAPLLPANQTLQVVDVEMTPPAGQERLFAVWSRQPLPLRLDRLQSLVEPKGKRSPASRPYVATRDMKRVQQSVQQLRPEDWQAVVLELDHSP